MMNCKTCGVKQVLLNTVCKRCFIDTLYTGEIPDLKTLAVVYYQPFWAQEFGMRLPTFAKLFEAQGGRCAVCRLRDIATVDLYCRKNKSVRGRKTGGVDLNDVRGLVCKPCSVRLGAMRWDAEFGEKQLEKRLFLDREFQPMLERAAISYLRKFQQDRDERLLLEQTEETVLEAAYDAVFGDDIDE